VASVTSSSASQELRSAAGRFAAGAWAGLLCGALIGEVGGRLAMFVLRVTSSPSVVGMESDDGFIIGRFSGETVFLVLVTAAAGTLGGLFYLLIRGWLPEGSRTLAYGVFGAAVGGAIVVHPDGIDFVVLEPRMLAVVMFVALPGLYGAATAVVAERFLDRVEALSAVGWVAAILPLIGMALLGPVGLAITVASALGWLLNRKLPLARWWRTAPLVWLGRAGLIAAFVWALSILAADTLAIL
jgi:hypothetical protein